jgi:hypothetical protein
VRGELLDVVVMSVFRIIGTDCNDLVVCLSLYKRTGIRIFAKQCNFSKLRDGSKPDQS